MPIRVTGAATAPRPIFAFVARVHAAASFAPVVLLENVIANAIRDGFNTFHTAVN